MSRLQNSLAKLKDRNFRGHPFDLLVGLLAPFLAFGLRDPSFFEADKYVLMLIYSGFAFLATLVAVVQFRVSSIISAHFGAKDIPRIMKASAAAAILTAGLMFLYNRLDGIPRSMPILHFMLLVGMTSFGRLIVSRSKVYRAVRKPTQNSLERQNVILIGSNQLASFYIRIIDTIAYATQRIVAVLDPNPSRQGRIVNGHEIIGTPNDLDRILEIQSEHGIYISQVVIAVEPDSWTLGEWDNIVNTCTKRDIQCIVLPEVLALPDAISHSLTDSRLPLTRQTDEQSTSVSYPSSQLGPYWTIKRWMDVTIATIALVILSPFFLFTAALVWLDCGSPVTFWQQRLGRHGRPIYVLKFRTLHGPLAADNRRLSMEERQTRIGRFLRLTRLDELPQLVNILIGDMSLIGPRPLLPADQPEQSSLRLSVAPGITGWAQVHGGTLVDAEEKSALDEWYIENASFKVDCKIALLTIRAFLKGDRRDEQVIRDAVNAARARKDERTGEKTAKIDDPGSQVTASGCRKEGKRAS